MTSGFLFDRFNPPPAPSDTHVTDRVEQKRLTGQNAKILARLQQGPATNRELAAISLKYTSRLSDIRAAGYKVEVVERDHATGLVRYQIFSAEGASR